MPVATQTPYGRPRRVDERRTEQLRITVTPRDEAVVIEEARRRGYASVSSFLYETCIGPLVSKAG